MGNSNSTAFRFSRDAMRLLLYFLTACVAVLLLSAGCGEETPSRDHIPALKEKVFLLQQAVKGKNRAAIDSLMSPEILSFRQDSDSLLRFVFGPEERFAFRRFGKCDIFYTIFESR